MWRYQLLAVILFLCLGCSSEETSSTKAPSESPAKADAKSADMASSNPSPGSQEKSVRTAEVPSSDGVVIRYEVRGESDPTLVFIHGWCCNRTFWEPQLAHFAKSHQVIAIDLAGHGTSDSGRSQWSMEAFGRDVAAVVEHVGANKVVLVGHSMGGPVMLEAASLIGERLVGLVGVDTFTDPNESYTAAQMAEFRKPFEADFPKAMREALHHEHDFFSEKTETALKDRITATMTAAPPDMGVGAFQGMLDFANERQRVLMSEVKVPFVCINARRSQEKVDDGKKHAPQFDVVTIPESGHFLMMEYPEEFNTVLAGIIAEMASGAKPVESSR